MSIVYDALWSVTLFLLDFLDILPSLRVVGEILFDSVSRQKPCWKELLKTILIMSLSCRYWVSLTLLHISRTCIRLFIEATRFHVHDFNMIEAYILFLDLIFPSFYLPLYYPLLVSPLCLIAYFCSSTRLSQA